MSFEKCVHHLTNTMVKTGNIYSLKEIYLLQMPGITATGGKPKSGGITTDEVGVHTCELSNATFCPTFVVMDLNTSSFVVREHGLY